MPPVNFIDEWGEVHAVPEEAIGEALARQWTPETVEQGAARVGGAAQTEAYSGLGDKVDAYAAGVARGFTGGLSDVALGALGDSTKRTLRQQREANPLVAGAGDVVGNIAATVTGVGPIGKAAAAGAKIAKAGEGASAIARIGRAGAGAAVEGAAVGLGSGVSELALSEDPVSVERAVATLSSRALYGAAIGSAAGSLAKGAEIGLVKAKGAMDEVAARYATRADVGDDLANLDAKGLRAAETAEREAIETTRVAQRQELADEIVAFRREIKAQKQFLTTKDVNLPAVGEALGTKELGRIAMKANKQLDNVLDNPTALIKNPGKALDALQRQENALAKLLERGNDLRQVFASDATGARLAALETIAPALERNRALQAKIASLSSEATSPRLAQIAAAKDAIADGARGGRSLAEQMAGGTVFNVVTGAVAALPLPGASLLAPMLGARAANLVSEKVAGRLGKAMAEGQVRAARAVGAVFEKGARGVRRAAPVSTRVLTQVAFAPSREAGPAAKRALPQAFRERAQELREQVAVGPEGRPMIRPQARARIAGSLAPLGAMQPMLADRMEALAVRRLEFLAGKLPRRPELGALQFGPDRWQPSDMEMRTFARFVAAAEDPDGILERVADGAVTPEDAEVMRELYPEQLADVTRQILERLPTLRESLPYHRRLALSVLTGVPVDPSMEPRILATLQAQYATAQTPPKASPQFGSVRSTDVGTASQRREQGA
jgi:hypothetical protein